MYTDNSFIRLDWAAKNILRDKADYEIFEGLLTVLFKEKVKIIELLESESNKEKSDAKYNRVDIKAKNSKDEIILVEIQLDHDTYYLERILFGVSKTITEHIGEGQDYPNVKKVYSINILYFNLGIGTDYLYHGTNTFVGVNTGDTLLFNNKGKKRLRKKRRNNIFPEYYIVRVEQFEQETVKTPLEEWMRYLKTGYISPETTAPGLQKARERLRVLSMSDEVRRAYEKYLYNKIYEKDIVETAREDGWEEGYEGGYESGYEGGYESGYEGGYESGYEGGYESGYEGGFAEGQTKSQATMIKNMRDLGLDMATICQITGLSEEQVKQL